LKACFGLVVVFCFMSLNLSAQFLMWLVDVVSFVIC